MGKKYNLEDRLFEKKEKRAKHKKIDTTIGQRKFSRANINRPVGAENAGRVGGGNVGHSIGKNPQPVNVKFTGKDTFDG